jgi:G:T-mismatch repair DNA endonuclease (very short patch repair protein)
MDFVVAIFFGGCMDGQFRAVPPIAREFWAARVAGRRYLGRDEYVRDKKRETGPVRVFVWRCSVDC